jgi:hypothetical protein
MPDNEEIMHSQTEKPLKTRPLSALLFGILVLKPYIGYHNMNLSGG